MHKRPQAQTLLMQVQLKPPPPEEDAHAQVTSDQYGNNTPTKRSSSSGVWAEVKRLKGTLNNADGDGTHICLVELKSEAAQGKPVRLRF